MNSEWIEINRFYGGELMSRIVGYVECKPEDYVDNFNVIHIPEIMRCIALKDIHDFSTSEKPSDEEYAVLVSEGFSEYEPDNIDGLYHFARKEYLV